MDFDFILKELGQFGKYQLFCFTVFLFPLILSGFRNTEYVFTTIVIPHRCRVPECEGNSGLEQFETSWLHDAVPFMNHHEIPYECLRYRPLTDISRANQTSCSTEMFNKTETITCKDWVFSEPTRTMATDFHILCPEEYWKLTFLSSCFVVPSFIGRPIAGFISDRFGRKILLLSGCMVYAVNGLIRSFSVSYVMSAALEIIDGFFAGSVSGSCFILALEMLPSKKRTLGCVLICIYFSLGEATLALVMWYMEDWRLLLRNFYPLFLSMITLHWLLPESLRWLYTQRRYNDIENIYKRMAKMNNTGENLSKVLEQLHSNNSAKPEGIELQPTSEKSNTPRPNQLKALYNSRILMLRLASFSCLWVFGYLTYYGISQFTAIFESNHRYLSFLLVSLVEVPARVSILWLPDWPVLGRKGTTAWSFFLCALTCFMLNFIDHEWVVLGLALLAKFSSTISLTVMFIYTTEVFPTEVRHLTWSICSISGAIGAALSQETPLINLHFNPMILFSLTSLVGASFILTVPETLNTPLPNTIKDAENLGVLEVTKI